VIEPEPIQWLSDYRHIAGLLEGLDDFGKSSRITGKMLRMREGIVPIFRKTQCSLQIFLAAAGRTAWLPIVNRAN
jgi:hypothetical protein